MVPPSQPHSTRSHADGAESSIELLQLAQKGDRDALDRLCTRYLPALRRWASGRLPPRARSLLETEDLVQETLVRAIRNIGAFEHRRDGALLAYLRTAVHNRVVSEIRKSERRPAEVGLDEALHHDPTPSPLDALIGSDQARRYEAALASLRDEDREVIIARLELHLSFAEVAALQNKSSEDAARMAFKRALLRLAERMKHERG